MSYYVEDYKIAFEIARLRTLVQTLDERFVVCRFDSEKMGSA